MVGNRILAQKCEEDFGDKMFRHVYGTDIVPRMPPRVAGRFEHFGVAFRSSVEGWTKDERTARQAFTTLLSNWIGVLSFVKQQLPLLRAVNLPYSWGDHSPLLYMRCSRMPRPGSELDYAQVLPEPPLALT
jgi:hypothetical protein